LEDLGVDGGSSELILQE